MNELIPLAMAGFSLLRPLYIAFGWVMEQLYFITGNFGVVIILFTILLRLVMLPLGIKQQKSTIKQQALQGEIAEIQRAYPNDKQKQQQLQMELYKRHGASPLSGCLPSLLQLIIIWPIFQIIRAPMTHMFNVSEDVLKKVADILYGLTGSDGATLITEAQKNNVVSDNIPIISALTDSAQGLARSIQEGLRMDQLVNLNFLGLDLADKPTYNPSLLFGADTWRQYLPLLVIPILVVGTSVLMMRITKLTMPNRRAREEAKAREKVNPARAGQTPDDKSESMMKTMNTIMPIFMLITTFSMPASMGIYWIIGNLMAMAQSFVIYYLFVRKPDPASDAPADAPPAATPARAKAKS